MRDMQQPRRPFGRVADGVGVEGTKHGAPDQVAHRHRQRQIEAGAETEKARRGQVAGLSEPVHELELRAHDADR